MYQSINLYSGFKPHRCAALKKKPAAKKTIFGGFFYTHNIEYGIRYIVVIIDTNILKPIGTGTPMDHFTMQYLV